MINGKKITIIVAIVISMIILGFLSYYIYYLPKTSPEKIIYTPCLSDDEMADFDYDIDLYNSTGVKLPVNPITTIYIKNKESNEEIFRFVIPDVRINSPNIEIHKCGVYVIRNFELDEKKNFYKRRELWHYSYNGKGEVLMNAEQFYPYSSPIRVNPSETFLALDKLYFGHPDYSIVIKNLKSPKLEDILIIKPTDIWQNSPQLNKERRIGVVGWSKNGKYFWGGSESQIDYAYFRINIDDREKKNLEVFPMPDDAVNYGPPQVDTGYIWYIYGMPWVGFEEDAVRLAEEWRKEGKKEILFLYNLFTKKQILLETFDDPLWFFKPKWLSDTELEYELPTGEKKIYKIEEE